MLSYRFLSAVAASMLLSMASAAAAASSSSSIDHIPTPTATVFPSAMTEIGCFSTGTPLENHGDYNFQSSGNCQKICVLLQKPVMGLSDGINCWCGDEIPPKSSQVSNSSCDTTCAGIDTDYCGGDGKLLVYLTGETRNQVPYYSISSSSAAPSTTAVAASSQATSVVLVTQSSTPSSKPKPSGPNKAGIAAGVVVGVVALGAIIAGVILYLRHKRRREVEDEYRRQASVNQFVAGGKLHTSNSSMTDSRLDPEFMNRRASNGSIADNEDYSRRILKVTNPDGN